MHRIAPRDTAPSHMDAVRYLNAIIIDMKRRFYRIDGLNNTSITMAYLLLWPEHQRDLLTCDSRQGKMRLAELNGWDRVDWDKPPHQEAVDWIDSYILLYPEIIAGTREVTLEDIETFERLIMPLRDCQQKVVWYR